MMDQVGMEKKSEIFARGNQRKIETSIITQDINIFLLISTTI